MRARITSWAQKLRAIVLATALLAVWLPDLPAAAAVATSSVSAGGGPHAVAVSRETSTVYVANTDNDTVTVLADTYGGGVAVAATVATGRTPYALAVNPVTNKTYVANADSNTVTIIDGATYSTATVAAGTAPVALAVNTATNKVYVVNAGSGDVTVIDGATNSTATVPAGDGPFAVAVNEATNRIYVANMDSNQVTVIDGVSLTTTAVATGDGPNALAVNPVTNRVYVANFYANSITVIDGATGDTSTVAVGNAPNAVEVNPATGRVYVANDKSGNVTVIDGSDHTTTAVATGAGTNAIAVNPETNKVYAANYAAHSVTVIDGASQTAVTVPAGQNPIAIAVNAATGKVFAANFNSGNVTVIEEHRETDADLGELSVSAGTFSPAFDPLIGDYTVQVDSETEQVTVTASTYDPAASLTVTGQVYSGSVSVPVMLQEGANALQLVVQSPDGLRSRTYTLTINRAVEPEIPLSANADLSQLSLSAGSLDPAFDPAGLTYSAEVGYSVANVSVTAATYDAGATMKVNGVAQASGVPVAVNLAVGANTVAIVTTAENGITSKTYTLTIHRESAGGSSPESGGPVTSLPEPDDVRVDASGVTLGSSAAIRTVETDTDGKRKAVAQLRAESLNKAINMLKDDVEQVNPAISYVWTDMDTEAVRTVGIPAKALTDAALAIPGAVISIRADDAAYALPVNIPAVLALLKQQSAEQLDRAVVYVTMEMVAGADSQRVDEIVQAAGATLVSADGIVKFAVHAEVDGVEYPFPDYAGAYATRSVPIGPGADVSLTAVWIDLEAGSLHFVPAVWAEGRGNGGLANLFHTRNGVYALIRHNKSFADVAGHWAKADVELLASKLIANGVSDTSYEPERGITRAEFAGLIVRALGLADRMARAGSFSDIAAGDWYAGAVGAAAQAQLVNGFEDGTFRPGEVITREQMAVLAARALAFARQLQAPELPEESDAGATTFGDQDEISVWARAAVGRLAERGILTGMSEDRFAPQDNVTRAQAAAVVRRLLHEAGFIN